MGKKKKVTIGYWYSFGIHSGVSRGPVDELVEFKAGDRTAWKGSVKESGRIYVDAPNLFGGEKKEGGIQGWMDIMMGESNQVAPSGLVGMLGRALPGYRRMFTTFFDGKVAAMNPYPKKWSFRVRRALKGWENNNPWYAEKARIILANGEIHAMNGAHIIYECLTNREWGRGLHALAIDTRSFGDAADTLFDEGVGLCLRWARKDSVRSFIQAVLDHIGGALYTDRTTGLLVLKLIRGDYIKSTLPLYTTDNGLLEVTESVISALPGLINQVIVNYRDPITDEERSVRVQSLAAIQATNGTINTMTKDYPGFPTAELALRAAQRDLQSMAFPLRRLKLVFDRRAWQITPAGVFRISNPTRGLGDIVVRVGTVEDGTLLNGKITVTAVQDIFGFPLSAFAGIQPPRWNGPDRSAKLAAHKIIEVPYTTLAGRMDPADFDYVSFDAGYLGTLAQKPTDLAVSYDIGVKEGPASPEDWP